MNQTEPKNITEVEWSHQDDIMVSIVVTTYNHEKFITKAIESILMQKVNFKVEVLINDDASTDNTAKIVKDYEAKYPFLFRNFYQKENQYSKGLKPWFNVLFPAAKGKYIAICEGDDYWTDPSKLRRQVQLLEANLNYALSAENAIILYDSGVKNYYGIKPARVITVKEILRSRQFATASIVFRNISNIDLTQINQNIPAGDTPMVLLLSKFGELHYYDIVSSVYRRGAQGVTNEFNSELMKPKLILYQKMLDNLTDYKFSTIINKKIRDINNNGKKSKGEALFIAGISKLLGIKYEFYFDWENESIFMKALLLVRKKLKTISKVGYF